MSAAIRRLNAALSDRYRIEHQLDEGGMATVYLATDLKHEREVAIKVLRPELAAVMGAERFLAEIKTTANLQHPHILPLFDSGEADGLLFYVMPYVEGESLRDRLDREKQLPVDEAVRIARAVAAALDHAHRQGVIHRDIKPANILLQDGEPVVADFGIALAVSAAGGGRLTETGMSVGTPHYMSPEQASSEEDPGPRSDIYALASVLYEMLTGDPPHTGPTAQAVLMRILTEEPRDLSDVRRSVPRNVGDAVAKALEKLPADRFASAATFGEALGSPAFRYERGLGAGVAGGTGSGRARSRWKLAALTAIPALVIGVLIGRALGSPTAGPESIARYPLPVAVPELQASDIGSWAAIDPTGESMVYLDSTAAGPQLFRKLRHETDGQPVAGTVGGSYPFFSPDGRHLGFRTADGRLATVPITGGTPRTLADSAILSPHWGQDGFIYYVGRGSIHRIDEAGGVPEVVYDNTPGAFASWAQNGVPYPNSDVVLFSACGNCSLRVNIYAIDTARDTVALVAEFGRMEGVLPSGEILMSLESTGLAAARFDPASLSLSEEPILIDPGLEAASIDVSASGDAVYVTPVTGTPDRLVRVARDGSTDVIETGWRDMASFVTISPDDRFVAVTAGDGQIWTKDLELGLEQKLTNEGLTSWRATWTPDGRHLAYIVVPPEGGWEIHRRRTDGSGEAERLASPRAGSGELGFGEVEYSDDGSWLFFRVFLGGGLDDLYARRTEGDTTTVVVSAEAGASERHPSLSPDNRWVAFTSDRSGRAEVYVRPFPDTERGLELISRAGGMMPRWSSRGDELFYSTPEGLVSVPVTLGETFERGDPELLFSAIRGVFIGVQHQTYDVTSDGQYFYTVEEGDATGEPTLVYVENWMTEVREILERARAQR